MVTISATIYTETYIIHIGRMSLFAHNLWFYILDKNLNVESPHTTTQYDYIRFNVRIQE